MKSDIENMDFLKAIIKANLNTRQLTIVYALMKGNTSTISLTTEDLTKKVKVKSKDDKEKEERTGTMSKSNVFRDVNSMILNNVLGRKGNGFYVRTTKIWGTINKEELEKVTARKLKKESKKADK